MERTFADSGNLLDLRHTAIHKELYACDKARVIRCKEDRNRSDLFRLANTSQRNSGSELLPESLPLLLSLE